MSWIVISATDGRIVSGPFDKMPASTKSGQSAIKAPLGWPDSCVWDPTRRGFVDGHALPDQEPAVALAMIALRTKRNAMLDASDKMAMPDRPEADRAPWLAYRQALRDLPEATADPLNPKWPEAPQ